MFDASYEALGSVFPNGPDETITLSNGTVIPKIQLYCLCKNCKFLPLGSSVAAGGLPAYSRLDCLDPMEDILKTLTSQFNESRPDYTSVPPNLQEVNVTVLTLAQQYCMEFRYIKLSPGQPPADNKIKTMCILFQVSSTIVYKIPGVAPDGNKILYAIDMQKTPIACIPDYTIDTTTLADVLNSVDPALVASQTVTNRAVAGGLEATLYYNNIAHGAAQAGGGKLAAATTAARVAEAAAEAERGPSKKKKPKAPAVGKAPASTISDRERDKAESKRIVAELTAEAEAKAEQQRLAQLKKLQEDVVRSMRDVRVNLRSILTSKRTIFFIRFF